MAAVAAAKQPNIVFILADDLGNSEVGFMNSTRGLVTPNLDALAAEGVVLRNYYVQPICTPTRSALMTGRMPIHLGTQSSVINLDTPWAIDVGETFLSQNLQDAGYSTALFGKWHLGMFRQSALPRQRGFDEHMGYLQGCGSEATHLTHCCMPGPNVSSGDHDFVCQPHAGDTKEMRGYDWFKSAPGGDSEADPSANHTRSAVMIGDAAVEYIGRVRKQSDTKPFFLLLPFQNIHSPYTSEQRHRDLYPADSYTELERTIFGLLSEMDEQVGRVVAALKEDPAVYDNTVIVFSSDNGAPHSGDDIDHPEQVTPGSPPWLARNFPYRGDKTRIWEGGVRVPGFVTSPLLPEAVRGTESSELFHVTDWLPTLVALAGGSTQRNRELDGHNVWQSIATGQPSPRTEVLYNVNPLCKGGQAVPPKAGLRMGKWKLIAWCYDVKGIDGANRTGPVNGPDMFASGPVLIDLEADPRETTNVADSQPKQLQVMLQRLEVLAETSVEPMQWKPPYQGDDYFCKDCPLHPGSLGLNVPWAPWIDEDGTPLELTPDAVAFADHVAV